MLEYFLNKNKEQKLSTKRAKLKNLVKELSEITYDYQVATRNYEQKCREELNEAIESVKKDVQLDYEMIKSVIEEVNQTYDMFVPLFNSALEVYKVSLEIQLYEKYIMLLSNSIDLLNKEIELVENLILTYKHISGYEERLIYIGNLNPEFKQLELLSIADLRDHFNLENKLSYLDENNEQFDFRKASTRKLFIRLENDQKTRDKIIELTQLKSRYKNQIFEIIHTLKDKNEGVYKKKNDLISKHKILLRAFKDSFTKYNVHFYQIFPQKEYRDDLDRKVHEFKESIRKARNRAIEITEECEKYNALRRECHESENYDNFDFYVKKFHETKIKKDSAWLEKDQIRKRLSPEITKIQREKHRVSLKNKTLYHLKPDKIYDLFDDLKKNNETYNEYSFRKVSLKK